MQTASIRIRVGLLLGILAFAIGLLGSSEHRVRRVAIFVVVLVAYGVMALLAGRSPRSISLISLLLAVGGVVPPYDGRRLAVALLSAAEGAFALSVLTMPRQWTTTRE